MRVAVLSYTGGATTCTVHLHFTKSTVTPPLGYKAAINFSTNGGMSYGEQWDLTGYSDGPNEVTHVFTVPDTLGVFIDLAIQLDFDLVENGSDECSFNISVGKVT